MTYEWFMEPTRNAKKSLLQRLYESFEKLTADRVRPALALETNTRPDSEDPLLVCRGSGRAYKRIRYVASCSPVRSRESAASCTSPLAGTRS